jgi:hypothetical protein
MYEYLEWRNKYEKLNPQLVLYCYSSINRNYDNFNVKYNFQQNRLLNPLKPKLVWITLNSSVRTAKKTQLFTITKINWLMQSYLLLKQMIHNRYLSSLKD